MIEIINVIIEKIPSAKYLIKEPKLVKGKGGTMREDQIKKKKIESLKLYKIYKYCKETETEWTEEKSNEHQEEMINILSKSFPNNANFP